MYVASWSCLHIIYVLADLSRGWNVKIHVQCTGILKLYATCMLFIIYTYLPELLQKFVMIRYTNRCMVLD